MRPVPVIPRDRLPHFWSGMSYTAKAGWLTAANLARDYFEACAILRAMRKPAARGNARPSVDAYQAALERQKLS